MRYKPKYNNLRITYHAYDTEEEQKFYCNEISKQKLVTVLLNQPIKDSGSRFITDSNIDFRIDDTLIIGDEIKRITEIPELKPVKDNNSRRGRHRKEKVLITT